MKASEEQAGRWLQSALGLSDNQSPFPWQLDLFRRFVTGSPVRSLDIPTGLGKTAVMAVWLVARACGAALPRRLVYVVDRRAVVDQATEAAESLRRAVDGDSEFKLALGLRERSLPISTLRGQHVDNREWLEDPGLPALIVGTVDMIGSRLLFEGYRTSRKMRPYHAALLGVDALVVLDEAHLVPPFERLLESVAEGVGEFGPRDEALRSLVPPLRILSLSATGRTPKRESLGLTAQDLEHPEVKKRLNARKRLLLKPLDVTSAGPADDEKSRLANDLAREAWALAGNGALDARVIVFCDSREVAGRAKDAVDKLAKTGVIDTEFFVGGRRIFERQRAKESLEQLGFIAGSKVTLDRPAFLFATSAAEVGVDLDADHMVCDLVPWERMVQRLGRVNRRGNGDATVVVVVEPEPEPQSKEKQAIAKKDKGEALDDKERGLVEMFAARVRMRRAYRIPFDYLPKRDEGFDASPGALRTLRQSAENEPTLKKLIDEATTPAPLRPALTRALVDAWSMTSLETHTGRPAIDPWLRGWVEDDGPQTTVVWRTYLPARSGPREPRERELKAFFEAAPPHTSEILETETFRVLEWLDARAKAVRQLAQRRQDKVEGSLPPGLDDVVAFVLSRAGDLRGTFRLRDLAKSEDAKADKERKERLHTALDGATLVLDARLAGLRKDGLLDRSEDAVPRTADDGNEWLAKHALPFRVRRMSADGTDLTVADGGWRERLRFAVDVSEEGEVQRWLIVEKWRHDAATEEDRSSARPQLLDDHQSWAELRARALAQRLGLAGRYLEMLAIAARIHDEGKRAQQWQVAFRAPANGPYAKTRGPINYTLLDGYRHELGSLLLAESDDRLSHLPDDLRDLALHLIAAHHGFARPVIGITGCDNAPPSALERPAGDVALRFARLQRRWGPWGLAWWEALLRAVDQQASRDNDAQDIDIAEPAARTEGV